MIKRIFIMALMILILIPVSVLAESEYIRENNFLDKSGLDYTAELNRFQAKHNLAVTGILDEPTKDMLYHKDRIYYDIIDNPPSNDIWVAINKSRKSLTIYSGREIVNKFPVALGKSSTPTPSGKTKVINKQINPYWGGMNGKATPVAGGLPNNPLGKRWLGLHLAGSYGYGVHGNSSPSSIGKYVSNGCIRMYNYDVEEYVYPVVPMNAPVWVGTDEELAQWGVRQLIDTADIKNIEDTTIEKLEPVNKVIKINDTTSVKEIDQIYVVP